MTNNTTDPHLCTCPDCHSKQKASNFMVGMTMGVVLGGAVAYIYSSPDGKKKARKLIEESAETLSEILDRTEAIRNQAKNTVARSADMLADQVREAAKDSSLPSFGAQLKQRFFKQNGQKLS